MTEWGKMRIGDVADINESSISGDFEFNIIEYIDTSSVEKGNLMNTQIIPLKEAPSRARRLVKKNDILISSVRPNLEHYYFVHDCKANTIASTGFVVISPKENVVPYFLYCLLTTPRYTKYLTQIANSHTSTFPSFNPNIIEDSKLEMPVGLEEQQEISRVFYNIDQKIDLIRRQNETLESIAQVLFKHWFVNFEFPDENGQPYKSSGGKMMLSEEFSYIPEGWSVGKLGDLCSILNEGLNPTERKDEMFYLYSIDAFDTGMLPKEEFGESILSNKFLVKSNTVLVSKLNPRTPRIWPVLKIVEKRAICSTEFQVLIPHNSYYCFIYNLLKSRKISKQIAQMASGTSGSHQRIRPDDILNISIIKPEESLVSNFEDKMHSIVEKTITNIKLTQTLAKTRDLLLPKLMSG